MRLGVAIFLVVALAATAAWPQASVRQNGSIVQRDIVRWSQDHIVDDPRGVLGDATGRGVNPFAITDSSGKGLCVNSAPTTGAYQQLCIGATATNGLVSWEAFGGASIAPLTFNVNGSLVDFPGNGQGNILGPNSSTIDQIATFNNTTGTLLKDAGGARLNSTGLNISLGVANADNVPGTAVEIQQVTSAVTISSSTAAFIHNAWTGNDATANVTGAYADLWYSGGGGNQAVALKGNVYTYPSAGGTPTGSLPHQFFAGPSIGTIPYLVGVYGRSAHYLPGHVDTAASFLADGLYNISDAVGGSIDRTVGLYVIPPYVLGTSNYAMYITANSCSPNCYGSTIFSQADPITIATSSAAVLDININPGNVGAFINTSAPMRVATNQTCSAQISGSATDAHVAALGANCGIDLTSQGTHTVGVFSGNGPLVSFNDPASGTLVNYLSIVSAPTANPPQIVVVGTDPDIGLNIVTKGAGQTVAITGNFSVSNQGTIPLLVTAQATPASASACAAGRILSDTGFIYACTASGVWKRVAITGGY